MVVHADDVARVCLFGLHTIAGHEGHGIGHLHVSTEPHVTHSHALAITAGADTQKRDSITVLWIHVRLDLEDEAREGVLVRRDFAIVRRAGTRCRRVFDEVLEHLVDAEIAERGAEEDGRSCAIEKRFVIEAVARSTNEFHFVSEVIGIYTEPLDRLGRSKPSIVAKSCTVLPWPPS